MKLKRMVGRTDESCRNRILKINVRRRKILVFERQFVTEDYPLG